MLKRGQLISRADTFCAQDPDCSQGFTFSLSHWYVRHGQSSSTIRPHCAEAACASPANLRTPWQNWSQICTKTTVDDTYSFRSFMSSTVSFDCTASTNAF